MAKGTKNRMEGWNEGLNQNPKRATKVWVRLSCSAATRDSCWKRRWQATPATISHPSWYKWLALTLLLSPQSSMVCFCISVKQVSACFGYILCLGNQNVCFGNQLLCFSSQKGCLGNQKVCFANQRVCVGKEKVSLGNLNHQLGQLM